MVKPLTDAELAKYVEKLRADFAGHKVEATPNTLTMAAVESIYALKISSNRIEKLTSILIFLTIILAILTIVLLIK